MLFLKDHALVTGNNLEQSIFEEGVSKQAHPLFISDTIQQLVYATISRIGDFKNFQFIP